MSTRKTRLSPRDLAVFAMLGAIMFLTKIFMQWIPNVHLLGLFISAFTLTYQVRALIPIYVYVFLDGAFAGFSIWWIPYLYIWLPLWLIFMIVGKIPFPSLIKVPFYAALCGLYGLAFGTLYAPAQALMFGLSFQATVAWIVAGLPFDVFHGISNLIAGTQIIPLALLLKRLDRQQQFE